MSKRPKPQKVNVFGDDETEAPNSKFNEAIEAARKQSETTTTLIPTTEPTAKKSVKQEKGITKQTIQKTDYFTQEQLDKLDDIEYLAKKKRGKTLRRFEILGILIEQCDADTFISNIE